MTRHYNNDDEIRISFPAREKPSPYEPWIGALAAAIIMRCFRDAIPRVYSNRRDRERKGELQRDALEWVTCGGDDFYHWCSIARVEPGRVRAAVVNASTGVLPPGVDMRRYVGRRLH